MIVGRIAPPGFEPGSPGPKPGILDRYTMGLCDDEAVLSLINVSEIL